MTDNEFTRFLEDNPRMIGVLFSLVVFLSSTGAAAASLGTTTPGP